MKHLYLTFFALALIACQSLADQEAHRKQEREKAYQVFKTLFPPVVTDTSARFSCALPYGPEVEGATLISDSLFRAALDTPLLSSSLYNPSSSYYALGAFPFTEVMVAYLVGAYAAPGQMVTHMYLYDLEKQDFTATQSLNYSLSGGDFSTQRDAWLYDLNQDQVRDLVYNLNFRYQTDSSDNSLVITDSLHTEIWDGSGFANYRVEDPNALRAELALEPVGDAESEAQGGLDEFF